MNWIKNMMKKVEIIKFLLVLIILCSSVAAESPVNQPPEAYFTASPSSGQSPLTVQFDASGSEDMDGTIVSYDWFFGDVNKKYDGNIVSYTYKNFGTFDASLKVTDDSGLTGVYTTKITVSNGPSLSVTIIPDQISVGPGESLPIRVNVTGKDGTPIPGALVTLSYTRGNFDRDSGNTDPKGQFSSNFKASEGTYRISATATKTGISQGYGETTVKVMTKNNLSVEIVSTSGSIEPNGTSTIRVTVKDSGGAPLGDAFVKLKHEVNGTEDGGQVIPASGYTDSSGQFTSTFTGILEGMHSIKAIVTKKGFNPGSGEVNFDVKAGNSIIFMILVFLLIIIIVTAFQEFWVKGRLQLIPLKTEVPCDGKSPIPIKVQFVDPSGKPKIQKKNCMVELKSSSGTIQNAMILAGKESVEAILTSSHVCGLVNVNARSGFHKATTKVNFAGHVAGIVLEVAPVKIPADGLSISSAVVKVMDDKGNFITSLDDWVIELTTSLGTVASPVKITPGTLSGIAILTSCKRTGTATVTATMGKFRCEKKVEFEELAERYCMHCGDPLKREINTCPNCKKTPPPNTEIKECNSCQTVIPALASFCDRCGAKQPV
ncbi:MAG: PKD domain-containing protein [Euryarchaeota archaeon]|nr:PKD domain-containing protein [Euryarchaeota archaeon]